MSVGWGLAALLACGLTESSSGAAPATANFPQKAWTFRPPAEMGLDAGRLDKIAEVLDGRGCIVKGGYVVKSWGDQAKR
ncbi:MAG: hypothetical protein JNG90_10015, partial [Planctomycetaceae bacterium]|nr:hypothetical protein [Planctomycetaceae bacterium]